MAQGWENLEHRTGSTITLPRERGRAFPWVPYWTVPIPGHTHLRAWVWPVYYMLSQSLCLQTLISKSRGFSV